LQIEVQEISDKLAQFEAWRLEGQHVRNRMRWRQKDDSRTKEFYSAIKSKTTHACITELVNEEGVSCFDQQQLEDICFSFYSKLYSQRTPD
jgi:hypothetical protein